MNRIISLIENWLMQRIIEVDQMNAISRPSQSRVVWSYAILNLYQIGWNKNISHNTQKHNVASYHHRSRVLLDHYYIDRAESLETMQVFCLSSESFQMQLSRFDRAVLYYYQFAMITWPKPKPHQNKLKTFREHR